MQRYAVRLRVIAPSLDRLACLDYSTTKRASIPKGCVWKCLAETFTRPFDRFSQQLTHGAIELCRPCAMTRSLMVWYHTNTHKACDLSLSASDDDILESQPCLWICAQGCYRAATCCRVLVHGSVSTSGGVECHKHRALSDSLCRDLLRNHVHLMLSRRWNPPVVENLGVKSIVASTPLFSRGMFKAGVRQSSGTSKYHLHGVSMCHMEYLCPCMYR